MKISEIEKENIMKFLASKWKENNCNLCGNNGWIIYDELFELREFQNGGLSGDSAIIPLIPVTCKNCGNTIMVNPKMLGLLDNI